LGLHTSEDFYKMDAAGIGFTRHGYVASCPSEADADNAWPVSSKVERD
jgi:hypothetical protein